MSVTVKNIIQAKYAESTQAIQYTATGVQCIIDKFTATNNGASPATLSINLLPLLGTASNANLIVNAKTIYPSETYSFYEIVGNLIPIGGMISTIASTPNTLTISATGREIV